MYTWILTLRLTLFVVAWPGSSSTAVAEFTKRAATPVSDTQCHFVQRCNSTTEYIAVEATTTTDRVCRTLQTCKEGTFQSQAPKPDADRECTPVTPCNGLDSPAPQYQAAPATPTSDRTCHEVTQCVTGVQYETTTHTATSDRVCSALTVCLSNEYETAAPTTTSDRACADAACPPEHYRLSTDPSVPKHCTPWRTCDMAWFEAKAPTSISDRICAAITTCKTTAGEYEDTPPTAKSNRVCKSCTVCAKGFKRTASCTATRNAVCERCRCEETDSFLSTMCTNGEDNGVCTACQTCSIGHFRSAGCDGVQDAVCSRCARCVADLKTEYTAAPCTLLDDVTCVTLTTCRKDEYETVAATTTSQRECAPLTPPCGADEFEAQTPNATANRHCEPLLRYRVRARALCVCMRCARVLIRRIVS